MHKFFVVFTYLILQYMQERKKHKRLLSGKRRSYPSKKRRKSRIPGYSRPKSGKYAKSTVPSSGDDVCETEHHPEPETCQNTIMVYSCSYCKKPGTRGHTRQPISSSGPHFQCVTCNRWFSTFGKNPDPKNFKYCMYCSFKGVKVQYNEVFDPSKLDLNTQVLFVEDYKKPSTNT